MIWDPRSTSERGGSPLVHHLAAQINETCGEGLAISADSIKEVAWAVEHYVRQRTNATAIPSDTLAVLAAQALSSIGEGEAARRLFLFGTGMLSPSQWDVTGGKTVWVLDLRKMTLRDDAPLELLFFNSLGLVLEAMANVWDASSGVGVLGLRHVCGTAAALAGCKKGQGLSLEKEIKELCVGKLVQIGEKRGWAHVPEVMDLDV